MPIPTDLERAEFAVREELQNAISALAANSVNYGAYSRARDRLRADADARIAALRLNGLPTEYNWTTYEPMVVTASASELEARIAAVMQPVMAVRNAEPSESDDSETEQHTCDACGEEHDADDMILVIDCTGTQAHARESCVEENGEYMSPDNTTRSEQRLGIGYWHSDQCVSTESGDTATIAYAENYWYSSENDGCWYTSYEHSSEYEAEQEAEERNGNMYDYDQDVLDVHGWPSCTPEDALCFGVELECESRNEDAAELTAALGDKDGDGKQYILKSDGSIDYGTEIVTLPYTLDYHQARFNWAKVLAPVQGIANSGANTTQCGIHVHINRAAVSALTLGKMLVFVNDPRNVKAITGIAQRSESSWAKFQAKKLTDGMRGKYADERYQALNVKDNTIEVRIFRGNLRAERVLKNIEFCHALVMYCRTASMQSLTWEAFWLWLRSTPANCKQYGNLIDFAHEILNKPSDGSTDKDI